MDPRHRPDGDHFCLFTISTGTFACYTLVSTFTLMFIILWVPETKGRTLEEIQWSFR
uniref:Major facilitator superfamily (MFS) profile domain-containing protein n=1 Tax=Aegilops tauschii subsp. strangulata TaxID=200361 RepID=A0A453J4Z4_AEGTS